MARYKRYSIAQSLFIPVRFDEQIIPGTFVHAINHLVDEVFELSIFDKYFSNDKTGAPAYNPSILLKIILYAYSLGIVPSRRIAACCETNVTFMALTGESKPHYTTIAKFVSSYGPEISELLSIVISVCGMEGLIGKKMFAIDGCKISSNASKEWSGTRKDFFRKKIKIEKSIQAILKKHQAEDKVASIDPDVRTNEEKAIQNLTKKAEKIQCWLDEGTEKLGSQGKPIKYNLTDPDSITMKSSHGVEQGAIGVAAADTKNQIILNAEVLCSSAESLSFSSMVNGARKNLLRANIAPDKVDEYIITADTGFHSVDVLKWIEAEKLNAFVPDKEFRKRDPRFATAGRHKRSIDRKKPAPKTKYFNASEFTFDPDKQKLICPAGGEMYVENRNYSNKQGLKGCTYAAKITDCRECKLRDQCIRGKKVKQRRVTIMYNSLRYGDTPVTRMIERFDAPEGRYWYSRRMGTIEPVFANIRSTLGLNRFTLRGKEKLDTQWKLFAMVHNIGKLARYAWK